MNFGDTEARGYIYKSNDPRDVEVKFIMGNVDIGDHGFSISGPTGKHSGSGCCSGFAYMLNLETTTNPIQFRFRKEMWHVSYHTDPKTGDWTHPKFNFKLQGHSGNIGIGYVRYNKKDGISSGHDSVILEAWGNPDPDDDPTNWIMLKRTEDTGSWGNDGNQCSGNKDQVGTWAGPKFRMKSNGSGTITFKHVSLREIDPTGDFDSTPEDPGTQPPVDQPTSTSRVLGKFTLMRDINIELNSVCSTGAGYSSFYDLLLSLDDKILSDSTRWDHITRATERAATAISIINGKVIKQFDVNLKKVGAPGASPLISAKIWSSDGLIKFTSSTTFAPDSDLTTSYATKTFDFSANTYTMQTGDRIGIEWTGTSDTDYVICGIARTNIIDSTNSYFSQYDTVNGWESLTRYDMGGKIYR